MNQLLNQKPRGRELKLHLHAIPNYRRSERNAERSFGCANLNMSAKLSDLAEVKLGMSFGNQKHTAEYKAHVMHNMLPFKYVPLTIKVIGTLQISIKQQQMILGQLIQKILYPHPMSMIFYYQKYTIYNNGVIGNMNAQ